MKTTYAHVEFNICLLHPHPTQQIKNVSKFLHVLHTRVCVIMFGSIESDLFVSIMHLHQVYLFDDVRESESSFSFHLFG